MIFVFSNNAKSTLAAPVAPGDTTVTLFTGTGALYPAPAAGQAFPLSMLDQSTGTQREIMYCTSRTGDVCTVTRAQEGTSAGTWVIGDFANLFITKGIAAAFAQTAAIGPQGGATSARPVSPTLYQPYFDTTLGLPLTCSQITPTVIWVTASGVSV
jgi:hypothetical protein